MTAGKTGRDEDKDVFLSTLRDLYGWTITSVEIGKLLDAHTIELSALRKREEMWRAQFLRMTHLRTKAVLRSARLRTELSALRKRNEALVKVLEILHEGLVDGENPIELNLVAVKALAAHSPAKGGS